MQLLEAHGGRIELGSSGKYLTLKDLLPGSEPQVDTSAKAQLSSTSKKQHVSLPLPL